MIEPGKSFPPSTAEQIDFEASDLLRMDQIGPDFATSGQSGAIIHVMQTWFLAGQQEQAEAVAMAIKDVQTYIDEHGLVETSDDESEKPIYRKPGFEGVKSFNEMEQAFSRFIRERRDANRLNRAQMGMMVGLHETIFARYERAFSKLQATRLIHLCEILDCSPIEMIHVAAPHFFGGSRHEADDKLKLIMRILNMPPATASNLLNLVEGLVRDSAHGDR